MGIRLRCSLCRESFPWDTKKAMPKCCPACGHGMGSDRADDDIVMPSIKSARTASKDDVYRQMETSSERRAEKAAQMAGTDVSEMSGLKITDLRETRHEGAVAAVPVNNEVSRLMEANPGVTGFQGQQGNAYAGNVRSGPHPNAGARTLLGLQSVNGGRSGRVDR